MSQHLGLVSLLVRDYDEAIAFYVGRLGFALVEDTPMGEGKRWVMVRPPGTTETGLLLARAVDERQLAAVGDQGGGRVWLFLHTDDFDRDHAAFVERGVRFLEAPRREAYGAVAVFEDLYGNLGPAAADRQRARLVAGGPEDQTGAMPALDHVNIQTTRLAETVAFYRELIGLEQRDPPGLPPDLVQWMHDETGRAIIHVSTVGSLLGDGAGHVEGKTGAVHHVALLCTGHDAMVERIERRGLAYRLNYVAVVDLKQIFVEDPNGVLIELNYPSGQH